MKKSIERRIIDLEQLVSAPHQSMTEQLLDHIGGTYLSSDPEATEFLARLYDDTRATIPVGGDNDGVPAGKMIEMAIHHDLSCARSDVLEFIERMLERIPRRIIAAACNKARNYVFPPETRARIRKLAGCIDGDGSVMPGYRLADNGCIVDDIGITRCRHQPGARVH